MIKKILVVCMTLTLSLIISCSTEKKSTQETPLKNAKVKVEAFGIMPDGKAVKLYTLKNKNGVEMKVMNYGGIITSLVVPDKNGNFDDVVLGYDSLSSYLKSSPFFGALIGRYGNRIAKGKFKIDGQEYNLPINNGSNHLHGGPMGFDKVYWNIDVPADSSSLKLTYLSVDGEQGYPGNLSAEVFYYLTDNDELKIEYKATTDKKTVVNLTQHSYFNLGGKQTKAILSHSLMIDADSFIPVDTALIPTGEIRSVKGTPFDFTKAETIGSRIEQKDDQLKFGRGYDHNWVLNNYDGKMRKVAELSEPVSGRLMEVFTTEPGLQFYSGNFLDGTLIGKNNTAYNFRSGLCLETQHYPDSPNQPKFPSVILNPGETYQTTTIYKFSTTTSK
jgi:aldose 1-epimerase